MSSLKRPKAFSSRKGGNQGLDPAAHPLLGTSSQLQCNRGSPKLCGGLILAPSPHSLSWTLGCRPHSPGGSPLRADHPHNSTLPGVQPQTQTPLQAQGHRQTGVKPRGEGARVGQLDPHLLGLRATAVPAAPSDPVQELRACPVPTPICLLTADCAGGRQPGGQCLPVTRGHSLGTSPNMVPSPSPHTAQAGLST